MLFEQRFLRAGSRLDNWPTLRSYAHPDRAGGLSFLSTVIRGYWPLCAAFSAIVAGRIANELRTGGSIPSEGKFLVGGLLAFVVLFVLTPFAVFVPILRGLKARGMLEYDTLGLAVGAEFERKWLKDRTGATGEILEQPDFSATIDLYSIIGNVHQIAYFPVGLRSIQELIIVTLLPIVLVALFAIPFDTVVHAIAKLLI